MLLKTTNYSRYEHYLYESLYFYKHSEKYVYHLKPYILNKKINFSKNNLQFVNPHIKCNVFCYNII